MGLCGKSCRAGLGKSSDAHPKVGTTFAMAVVVGRRKRPGQTRDLAVAIDSADTRLPARELLSTCCAATGKKSHQLVRMHCFSGKTCSTCVNFSRLIDLKTENRCNHSLNLKALLPGQFSLIPTAAEPC